jgi:(p)ppGpp synthase/HD superfamily hydrolase
VHTDIGNRCVGARVNGELVPLRTVLRNGDHVEILTSNNGAPHPSWLNYVVTSKARATIRNYLKGQRRKESIRLGRRLLKKELKQIGVRKVADAEKTSLLKSVNLAEWDDLLADIGMGNRYALVVARQLAGERPAESAGAGGPAEGSPPLVIRGTEGMMVTFARCCRPIPGDPILGFLTSGRGIVVHTEDCPNVGEFRKQPEKWIDVQWERGIRGNFAVTIRVETLNKRGVLAQLASVIAEAESNIENVTLTDRDGIYTSILFTIEVRNRRHLAEIMRRLRVQEPVVRINRLKG